MSWRRRTNFGKNWSWLFRELREVEAVLAVVKKREEQLNYQLDTVTQDIEWCQADIKDKQNWITAKSQEKRGKSRSPSPRWKPNLNLKKIN